MPTLRLRPLPPFRLDLTVWALRRLPINAMDRWDGERYRRVLVINSRPLEVVVTQTGPSDEPELTITTHGARLAPRTQSELVALLQRTLGLQADLTDFHHRVAQHKRIAALVAPFIGLKPPRLPSVFEAVLNGIACQQLSLIVGIHLLNRLCRNYGLAIDGEHAFPRPEDLAHARPAAISRLGFSTRKVTTLQSIARAIVRGELNLEGLAEQNDADALEALRALKGIGRWTAEYVLLRGLGRWDVFPADDVGSQAKLQTWLQLRQRPDYDEVHRILAPLEPYRGLIYFFLLLNHLRAQRLLDTRAPGAEVRLHPATSTF